MTAWQKEAKKWIVKAKQILRRKKWSEKIKEKTGKDLLVCLKCECTYEYKGEACLKEGKLVIKNAVCAKSKAVLERMINELHGSQEKESNEEKETAVADPKQAPTKQRNDQLYLLNVWRSGGYSFECSEKL